MQNPVTNITTTSKTGKRLNLIIGIIGGLSLAGTVWWFYRSKIWHPKVEVDYVDYQKGEANIVVGKKAFTIYKGSITSVGGDWGVKFSGPDEKTINRIELVNNGITHSYYAIKK